MSREHLDSSIPCKVSPGMFSSEYGVTVELPDGENVVGVFDESHVTVEEQPSVGSEVNGRLTIEIIEASGDDVLIEFTSNPNQHLIQGFPRAKVPRSFLAESRPNQN